MYVCMCVVAAYIMRKAVKCPRPVLTWLLRSFIGGTIISMYGRMFPAWYLAADTLGKYIHTYIHTFIQYIHTYNAFMHTYRYKNIAVDGYPSHLYGSGFGLGKRYVRESV